jgi:hypothetical protein
LSPETLFQLGDPAQHGGMRHFKAISRRSNRPFARYGQEIANVIPIHHLRGAYSIMSDQGFRIDAKG